MMKTPAIPSPSGRLPLFGGLLLFAGRAVRAAVRILRNTPDDARMGSLGYVPCADGGKWERLYGVGFDEAFRRNGNRSVGFDLEGPAFDTQTVARHFSAPDAYRSTNTSAKPIRSWAKVSVR